MGFNVKEITDNQGRVGSQPRHRLVLMFFMLVTHVACVGGGGEYRRRNDVFTVDKADDAGYKCQTSENASG